MTLKYSAFSPCGELFVCINDRQILTIWDTATNNVKQEFDVKLHLKTSCSSLIWGSFRIAPSEKEKASDETQFLLVGTKAGDIYLYDYNVGKLYNHFNAGHVGDVNDLSLYGETNSLFSCSIDKSVIIWDTISGKIKQQWTADEEEIYSICVVDNKNLLTGGSSVIWWNIESQSIIKKFQCQEAPVVLLKVVSSLDVSSSSYFLSSTINASKICAWSLNEKNSHNAVASFVAKDTTLSIDASKTFSKDNPLLLTAVTKTGNLVLFEHVLNGKTKNLTPQMTVEIHIKPGSSNSEMKQLTVPILSSKLLDCAESCLIAYGDSDSPIFESVNIFDCPKKLTLVRSKQLQEKVYDCFVPQIKVCNKLKKTAIVNGQSSSDLSYNSPKRRKTAQTTPMKESLTNNSIPSINETKFNDRMSLNSSPSVKKKQSFSKKLERSKTPESDVEEIVLPTDPSDIIATLLRGIEEENSSIINLVLRCDNSELIRASVKNLPVSRLNLVLLELYRELKLGQKRPNPILMKWLKEILSHNLSNLINCDEDLRTVLNNIAELTDIRHINQTLSRMRLLKGLLQVHKKNPPTDESESSSSDSDDIEELVDS